MTGYNGIYSDNRCFKCDVAIFCFLVHLHLNLQKNRELSKLLCNNKIKNPTQILWWQKYDLLDFPCLHLEKKWGEQSNIKWETSWLVINFEHSFSLRALVKRRAVCSKFHLNFLEHFQLRVLFVYSPQRLVSILTVATCCSWGAISSQTSFWVLSRLWNMGVVLAPSSLVLLSS